MKKLEIYQIPIGNNITLEKINPKNKEHRSFIKEMRDFQGRKGMFDIKYEIKRIENNKNIGTSYFIKKEDKHIGYLYLSDHNIAQDEKEIVLSMLISKKMRGMGYGKIVLKSVSEYLLNEDSIGRITVYVKDKNQASKKMVEACDFFKGPVQSVEKTTIYRRGK